VKRERKTEKIKNASYKYESEALKVALIEVYHILIWELAIYTLRS